MQLTRPMLLELAVQREICGEETKERRKQRASWLQHVYTAICIHSWLRKPGHHCNSSLLSQVPPSSSSQNITILPALITVLCAGAMLAPFTATTFLSAQARGRAHTLQHVEKKNLNSLARCLPLTESSIDNWTTVCAGGSSSRQNGKNPVRHS